MSRGLLVTIALLAAAAGAWLLLRTPEADRLPDAPRAPTEAQERPPDLAPADRSAATPIPTVAPSTEPTPQQREWIRWALRSLDEAPQRSTRMQVLRDLGKLGPLAAGAVPALVGRLAIDDLEMRGWVAWALAAIGEPALPSLLAAAAVDDERVRAGVASALGKLVEPTPASLEALSRLLSDRNEDVRAAAAHAFGSLGARGAAGADLLLARLSDPSHVVRRAAALAAGHVRVAPQTFVPALVARASDPEEAEAVREAAIWSLSRYGPEAGPSTEALGRAATSDAVQVSRGALLALRSIGAKAAASVPSLVAVANGQDEARRKLAALALLVVGPTDPAALALWREWLATETDSDLLHAAIEGLVRTGPSAVPQLAAAAADPAREEAFREPVGPPDPASGLPLEPTVRAIEAALREPSLLSFALHSAAQIGEPAARAGPAAEAIVRGRGNLELRLGAIETVVAVERGLAAPTLLAVLDDGELRIRARALQGLVEIEAKSPLAIAAFERLLSDADHAITEDAVTALEMRALDTPAAAEALRRAAQGHASGRVRAQARLALDRLAEEDAQDAKRR